MGIGHRVIYIEDPNLADLPKPHKIHVDICATAICRSTWSVRFYPPFYTQ